MKRTLDPPFIYQLEYIIFLRVTTPQNLAGVNRLMQTEQSSRPFCAGHMNPGE
jgi:hypothetical protein